MKGNIGFIGVGSSMILAAVLSAGLSAVIIDCPEPEPEPDYSKLAAASYLPEFEPYVPLSDYQERRELNQRQKRKLKRQQPHGRI